MGRVGAPGGAAGRGRARLGANGIVRPGNKSPASPPRHRENVVSTFLQKQEQADFFLTERGTKLFKPALDQLLISGLSPGRNARFVPGCRQVKRRLLVSVNPFHERHVREDRGMYRCPFGSVNPFYAGHVQAYQTFPLGANRTPQ